mgnify:CR=1 FL=1
MNKVFFLKSAFVIAFSFVTVSVTPVMAESQVITPSNLEENKQLLRDKLARLNFFTADFAQDVVSESGELLEQSSGNLAISKPNLANWHTQEPDELAIVSDGNDVWFYNPWIEQVSVYSLSSAIAKTPILLLTSKDELLWQQYDVTQINNRFVISAKDPNSQIKSLTLVFAVDEHNIQTSHLSQFSFLDATGQVSHIKLSNFNIHKVLSESLFKFMVPEGVQVDDQRAN